MKRLIFILSVFLVTGCAAGDPYMRLKGIEIYKTADDEVTGYVYKYEAVYPDGYGELLLGAAKEAAGL